MAKSPNHSVHKEKKIKPEVQPYSKTKTHHIIVSFYTALIII